MGNTKINTTDKAKKQAEEAKKTRETLEKKTPKNQEKAADKERITEEEIRQQEMREPLPKEGPVRSERTKSAADAITPKTSKKKKP